MPTDVHILATVLNDALIDATLLVFRTLRTGFPGNSVCVWQNGLSPEQSNIITSAASLTRCSTQCITRRVAHDAWIAGLLRKSITPFWLCDTDMVFWSEVEEPPQGTHLAGRYEPAFKEPWTKTNRAPRLHTCLLYCDPIAIRLKVRAWAAKWNPPGFPFFPQFELVAQQFVPQGGNRPPLFYDTCTGLYQAIGGTPFSELQNAAFDHLHCGTYSDRIAPSLPEASMARRSVSADIGNVKGLHASQEEYYRTHPPSD